MFNSGPPGSDGGILSIKFLSFLFILSPGSDSPLARAYIFRNSLKSHEIIHALPWRNIFLATTY
jgi:hypothetical protein